MKNRSSNNNSGSNPLISRRLHRQLLHRTRLKVVQCRPSRQCGIRRLKGTAEVAEVPSGGPRIAKHLHRYLHYGNGVLTSVSMTEAATAMALIKQISTPCFVSRSSREMFRGRHYEGQYRGCSMQAMVSLVNCSHNPRGIISSTTAAAAAAAPLKGALVGMIAKTTKMSMASLRMTWRRFCSTVTCQIWYFQGM